MSTLQPHLEEKRAAPPTLGTPISASAIFVFAYGIAAEHPVNICTRGVPCTAE